MSVPLSGGEIGVAEELLHRSEVGAAVEQVCGEGVPESVWMRGRRGPAVEHAPGVARREAQPAAVEEQRLGRRPVGEQVAAAPLDPSSQGVDRRLAEGHGALLAALAPDRGATPAEVEVADVERAELTDPQAADRKS